MADKEVQVQAVEAKPTIGLISHDVAIKYYGNELITGIFADQVVVSHLGGVFTLYFYQMQLPVALATADQEPVQLEQLKGIQEVGARCVARLVLTPSLMEEVSKAITTNLDRFKRLLEHQVEASKE
jgi:hypothetical protein